MQADLTPSVLFFLYSRRVEVSWVELHAFQVCRGAIGYPHTCCNVDPNRGNWGVYHLAHLPVCVYVCVRVRVCVR